jgi:phenylpyruvate tautomerase PptA (4-oxalocrotonate tautomerase family)
MPLIDLTYPEGALDPAARAVAVERLTSALLEHEGASENDATRVMSRAFVHEIPPDAVNSGGRPAERPIYRLVFTVPEGTMLHGPGPFAAQSRCNLFREATEILLEAEGAEQTPSDAGRVFCLLHEVPDGHWGGMGTVFRMEDIVAFANPDAPQTAVAEQAREALDAGDVAVRPPVPVEAQA